MPEEEKVNLTPQELAKLLKGTVEQTIKAAQAKSGDYHQAAEPFQRKTESERDAEKYGKIITRPKSKVDAKKELVGFKTGTFVDDLFFGEDDKSLGGIPIVCQLGLTGVSGTGKSILVQEIALRCANEGRKVVFITSEDAWSVSSPRQDLQSRMKRKAEIMGLDWDMIRANLFVLDSIKNSQLRNWTTLVETYRYLVEILRGIDLLIIDSLSLLEVWRGNLKWRVIELSRYNQVNGVTAIYVCQRSEEKPDTYAVSGGQGVVHNLDALLCVDFKKASGLLKSDLNKKMWQETHFVRLMACRLSGFDRIYHECEISSDGFLRLKKQIVESDQKA